MTTVRHAMTVAGAEGGGWGGGGGGGGRSSVTV